MAFIAQQIINLSKLLIFEIFIKLISGSHCVVYQSIISMIYV